MTARVLEANGIATVVIGSAWDVVTWCGVPRFYFNDLPLGNPIGPPWDRAAQRMTVERALALIDDATGPVTVTSDLAWSTDDAWKANYMKVDDTNREMLRRQGEENRRRRREMRDAGLGRK